MKFKKGIFFSLDALIALVIIFIILFTIVPVAKFTRQSTEVHRDLLESFSALTVEEIDNSYVQSLISSGEITDLNNTILEQIGEFYVTNITKAQLLAQAVLDEINLSQNIGIWYQNKYIASLNRTDFENSDDVETARQTISGIQQGQSVTGFSTRAFLISSLLEKYFYFGGYIGDGNISAIIEYNGNISEAEMELVISSGFELIINNVSQGTFSGSASEFVPDTYTLNTTDFMSGNNTIEFRGDKLHIAGGFFKITFESAVQYSVTESYKLPGIEGLINIYDGFFIDGKLTAMEVKLHLNSSHPTFLRIGNITVYENTTNGEETIVIQDSELSALFDYNKLVNKTIPVRLGLQNVTYTTNGSSSEIDSVTVTDLSGSMNQNVGGGKKMIDLARDANRLYVEVMLNDTLAQSENRVGLVGYGTTAKEEDSHNLTINKTSLNATITDWSTTQATCICCGINAAVDEFLNNSNTTKSKTVVIMTDGKANKVCPLQNTGDADQDAINAACDANSNHNIIIHAVGFGDNADEATLQSIASCGQGDYYFTTIDDIVTTYGEIAENIIEASFQEQTISASGDLLTKLFPDSEVRFTYEKTPIPVGIVVTLEKAFTNETTGSFSLPSNATIVETRATSYSGPRWTNTLHTNNSIVYNLSKYGSTYIELGDPYVINIPNSNIEEQNQIDLRTALSPSNSTGGSTSNKLIYTFVKDASVYSKITAINEGCNWNIEFEDSSTVNITSPSAYNGTNACSFTSSSQVYDENDAMQSSVYELLQILDLDNNNKVDVKFTEQNLEIEITELTGIPYTWSTEVQIRTWI